MNSTAASPNPPLGRPSTNGPARQRAACAPHLDLLEDRRLLSATAHDGHRGGEHWGGGGEGGGYPTQITIDFSLAPTAVQTGLTLLASAAGDTAPTSTTSVILGNRDGIETYSLDEGSSSTSTAVSSTTGTADTLLTVNVSGTAVPAPTHTTTTFGAITNPAVTAELTAIASALSLIAPTSTTSVDVDTASSGAVTYSVALTSTSTTSTTAAATGTPGGRISVDANGNPAGDEQVPLSVLSSAIQSGLTSHAPSGATALTAASLIRVQTVGGVTLYTAKYASTGTQTSITVNTAGTLTSLPSTTQVDYSTLSSTVQTELQTLATAEGYTGTIPATQTVDAHTEAGGTVIYSVRLSVTNSSSDTTSTITIATDAAGDPTVVAGAGDGGNFGGPGGAGGGDCSPPSGSSDTGTTTTSGYTKLPTTGTTPSSSTTTSTKATRLAALKAAVAAKLAAHKAAAAAKLAKKEAAIAAKRAAAALRA